MSNLFLLKGEFFSHLLGNKNLRGSGKTIISLSILFSERSIIMLLKVNLIFDIHFFSLNYFFQNKSIVIPPLISWFNRCKINL